MRQLAATISLALWVLLLLNKPPPSHTAPLPLDVPLSARAELHSVHTVHLAMSHHLDVGLDLPMKVTTNCAGYATKIVQRYFDVFIPRILALSKQAQAEDVPFAYQIHGWIAALYVDCVPWQVKDACPNNPGVLVCPPDAAVQRFDAAVRAGTIVYTASPFNIDAQAVGDPELFTDLVTDIAGSLDERYHRPPGARVWSNVDVKGFARSSIPLLKTAGVEFLSIGQNGHPSEDRGSTHSRGMQPAVGGSNATMFRWRDPRSRQEIVVMYHDGYGGPFLSPLENYTYGSDDCIISSNGVALASYFRSDNAGPPDTLEEVKKVVAAVRKIFPNATVLGSSFDGFATQALTPDVVNNLPVFDQDWGDQWLTGMSTDPYRLAAYRAVMRSRANCISAGHPECKRHSLVMRNVTRWLAKVSEHTQGAQNEQWTPGVSGLPAHAHGGGDVTHWSNEQFRTIHSASKNIWESGELTWLEARVFTALAVDAIPAGSAWALDVQKQLAMLSPKVPPPLAGLKAVSVPQPGGSPSILSCGEMVVAIDASGALTSLRLAAATVDWATNSHPLMQLSYVTYNKLESWDAKLNLTCTQPGCPNPVDAVWHAQVSELYTNASQTENGDLLPGVCMVVAKSAFSNHLHEDAGAPSTVWTTFTLNPKARSVFVDLSWVGKTTTRLPESLMLDFRPLAPRPAYGWGMDILNETVRPNETASGTTNQWQRGIWKGVQFSDSEGLGIGGLHIESLDAGMVCPIVTPDHPMYLRLLGGSTPMGEGMSSTPFALDQIAGMAFNLYNNLMPISGFAQWYPFGVGEWYQKQDEISTFRFLLHDGGRD